MEAIRALGASCEKNSIKNVTILVFRVINSNLAGHKKTTNVVRRGGLQLPASPTNRSGLSVVQPTWFLLSSTSETLPDELDYNRFSGRTFVFAESRLLPLKKCAIISGR